MAEICIQKPPALSYGTIHFRANVSGPGALRSVAAPTFLTTRATACLLFTTRQSSTGTPLGPGHRGRSPQAQGRRCFVHSCRLRVGRLLWWLQSPDEKESLHLDVVILLGVQRGSHFTNGDILAQVTITMDTTTPGTMIISSSSTTPQLTSNGRIPRFLYGRYLWIPPNLVGRDSLDEFGR